MRLFIKIAASLYLIACIVLYILQDSFIFNPEKLPEDYSFRMGQELEIPLDDVYSMNTLYVDSGPEKPKGVILYLHGNRGSIRFGIYQLRTMRELGYDIMIPDYRSYGKTEGSIQSEEQLFNDVQKAYDHLKTRFNENEIILVGYSLGTGMASYLASHNKPKTLVLVAPFTSITDIKNKYLWFFPDFLLKFKLPVNEFMNNIECPVTIVHGTRDKIVDYRFSEEMKNRFGDKITLIRAERESHRSIIFSSELSIALEQLLLS